MLEETSSSRSNPNTDRPCLSVHVMTGSASVGVRRVAGACGPVVTQLVTHQPALVPTSGAVWHPLDGTPVDLRQPGASVRGNPPRPAVRPRAALYGVRGP